MKYAEFQEIRWAERKYINKHPLSINALVITTVLIEEPNYGKTKQASFKIRDTINFKTRSDLNNLDIEFLSIEICKYKTKPFLVSTWYKPPDSTIDLLKKFENILQQIDMEGKESIILVTLIVIYSQKTRSIKTQMNSVLLQIYINTSNL